MDKPSTAQSIGDGCGVRIATWRSGDEQHRVLLAISPNAEAADGIGRVGIAQPDGGNGGRRDPCRPTGSPHWAAEMAGDAATRIDVMTTTRSTGNWRVGSSRAQQAGEVGPTIRW